MAQEWSYGWPVTLNKYIWSSQIRQWRPSTLKLCIPLNSSSLPNLLLHNVILLFALFDNTSQVWLKGELTWRILLTRLCSVERRTHISGNLIQTERPGMLWIGCSSRGSGWAAGYWQKGRVGNLMWLLASRESDCINTHHTPSSWRGQLAPTCRATSKLYHYKLPSVSFHLNNTYMYIHRHKS